MRLPFIFLLSALCLAPVGASAAVMTFESVVREGNGDWPNVYVENGITAEAVGGWIEGFGGAHLDEAGTQFPYKIEFSMAHRFDAESLLMQPSTTEMYICDDDRGQGCEKSEVPNVLFQGYDGAQVVAEDSFFMGPVSEEYTYEFASDFSRLSKLVVGFATYELGPLADGRYLDCFDVPCTHYNIDDVTLAPVPLPASLPLLAVGIGGIFALQRRRRTSM